MPECTHSDRRQRGYRMGRRYLGRSNRTEDSLKTIRTYFAGSRSMKQLLLTLVLLVVADGLISQFLTRRGVVLGCRNQRSKHSPLPWRPSSAVALLRRMEERIKVRGRAKHRGLTLSCISPSRGREKQSQPLSPHFP